MAASTCDLCDLPTPDPPVTGDAADGTFCCRGCLQVAGQLDAPAEADPAAVREALGTDVDDGPEPRADVEAAYLAVDGMHCATCEAFLEARATRADGVVDAEASYAAEVVKLSYDPDRVERDALADAVSGLGYRARDAAAAPDRGTAPPWRLLVGGFAAMPLMLWYAAFLYPRYLGVGPADPAWTAGTELMSMLNLWFLATVVLGVTGYPILRGAFVSLRAGRPNMDLLVALAAVNAYLYSAIVVVTGGTEVYFDIAVVVVMAVTLGNYYEGRIKRRAAGTLAGLTEERVESARRRTPAGQEEVSVGALDPGDEVVVRPGERVPVDGTVVEGTAAVDESLLTGESRPVRRAPDDAVIGGSVVLDDALVVSVGEGAQSTAEQLAALLWDVQSSRPGVQRAADRLASVFVPFVLVVAAAAAGWQAFGGAGPTEALLTGLTVLVVACPCALGLATPLAVASGVRAGLERGTVVTDAAAFETAPDVDLVAFDKTGTLTTGEMRVTEPAGDRAMAVAAALEAYSSHPVADAVTRHTPQADRAVAGVETHPGLGVSGRVDGTPTLVGHPDLFSDRGWPVPSAVADRVEEARAAGTVPVVVGWNGRARDVIVVGDEPRPGWEAGLEALDDRGHDIVVVTGDEAGAARRFRDHPAVDRVFSGIPPEAKAEIVERLRLTGTTAMVGDGTNDAPALAAADLGIAMGSGTALAADAADAVVRTGDLSGVLAVFDVVHSARRRIRQNLGWAFLYNAVAIPIAAAGFLNPLVAAVAMAASSLLVVGNSARSFGDGAPRARETPDSSAAETPMPEEPTPGTQ
ncbi:MAG: heavy metal translocating P-type ATPase [Halobacteriales archaeon]